MTAHNLRASYPGTVVLDIGEETGALIVYTEPRQLGQEIDLQPQAGGPSTHSAVRERRLGPRTVYCAVYPRLPAGTYLLGSGDEPQTTVLVKGGAITELRR
jgi:hypothetical protein